MSAKILEGAVGKVADRWLPNILGSPLLFWVGVFLLWIYSLNGDWREFVGWFTKLPETSQLIAIGLAISVTIVSDFAVQQIELPVLRALEGYWPRWFFARGRRWLIVGIDRRQKDINQALATIKIRELQATLSVGDIATRSSLENQLALLPKKFDQDGTAINSYLMPTRLGNILRAYERKPSEKYGLEAIVCWPRLWLLLPDPVKLDLSTARSDLNAAVRLWIWSILFTLCGGLHWIAIPVSPIVATLVYYLWILPAAQTYGILIDATFDTQRHLLYKALRFPLPETPQTETQQGRQLTQYLLGASQPTISFHPSTD